MLYSVLSLLSVRNSLHRWVQMRKLAQRRLSDFLMDPVSHVGFTRFQIFGAYFLESLGRTSKVLSHLCLEKEASCAAALPVNPP